MRPSSDSFFAHAAGSDTSGLHFGAFYCTFVDPVDEPIPDFVSKEDPDPCPLLSEVVTWTTPRLLGDPGRGLSFTCMVAATRPQ